MEKFKIAGTLSVKKKKEKTLKQIADLHHAFKTTLMHDYIAMSWHNQDSE